MKQKKLLAGLGIILAIAALGYWFFFKTIRGSSLALYAVAGWHAPLSVRFECARETDSRVAEKFLKPLNFDPASKDLLKNFWFYSYYRGCLFQDGYDFKGNAVPRSAINGDVYNNPFAGISFRLAPGSAIAKDNALNVDIDDQLYISQIHTPTQTLSLHYYTNDDQYKNFEDLNQKFQGIRGETAQVVEKTVGILPDKTMDLHFSLDNGNSGIIFLASNNRLFIISGQQSQASEMLGIEQSIKLSPSK